ncbi:MAG: hypothetical protein IIA85_01220 [Nanoarchaeota archaeon]|nr:hypothetical protein [Nanoarchaeota archaeon]
MRWFGKNEKEKLGKGSLDTLPELPKLPKLPQIGGKDLEPSDEPISQLPSYPPDSFGEKFSQNAIKEAVAGKIGDKEVFDADESLDEIEKKMMPEPLEMGEIPYKNLHGNLKTKVSTIEPVFVRIDKFEEGLKIFEQTKVKISEIEKFLEEMKKINEKEEKELQSWEREVQTMKKNFEKINQDIFSKI